MGHQGPAHRGPPVVAQQHHGHVPHHEEHHHHGMGHQAIYIKILRKRVNFDTFLSLKNPV
ncbi:hypothetical protein OESDEN_23573 [Oesophagostomum dentatum]|uniref:Uncharacterized protein n=1 Tax=Oesophagostomum dentatum TaxID=61180 RepID=A0A0B1RZX8_OESDE|nr:hypothetical protein OESDEN_23573 [Oesophagostomum dentatum]